MASIQTRFENIPVGDGSSMRAFFAHPTGASRLPAVIVFQEIFGVNGHIQSVTKRLAEAGFAALAPELFHRASPGLELGYGEIERGRAERDKIPPGGIEADARAAHAWLSARPECDPAAFGAIGFCFGGNVAFQANAFLPLRAAVSYYGGGIAPAHLPLAEKQQGPILFYWAGKDHYIPLEQREAVAAALRAAGRDFAQLEVSYADHGFFCDERGSFEPRAAAESWALTLQFLRNRLEPRR